jgi:hypothetical protein
MLQHELIFCEPEPCSTFETGLDDEEEPQQNNNMDPTWNEIFMKWMISRPSYNAT